MLITRRHSSIYSFRGSLSSALAHISSLHRMFWMSNKSVRLALVVSVMCTPPVSFQTSHESMVPNAKCSSLSTLPSVSSHSNFEPEK